MMEFRAISMGYGVSLFIRRGPQDFITLTAHHERVEEGDCSAGPAAVLSETEAASLMQALWDAGIRPNDGEGSAGHVAALKQHVRFAEEVARFGMHHLSEPRDSQKIEIKDLEL